MPEPTVRAFVAVELLPDIHVLLETRQHDLRASLGSAYSAIRWTRPESVHITLQFLGDVPTTLIRAINAAIAEACTGYEPLKLSIGNMGAFPNLTRPRVIWIGLEGDIVRLGALAAAIGKKLQPLGYKPDKPLQAHITLGRVRETARPDDIRAISQAIASPAAQRAARASFEVASISLMESHLQPGGSIYSRLVEVRLGA